MDIKIVLKNYLQKNLGFYIRSGFLMSTTSSFKTIENTHDVYRGKDFMKKFCKSLREQAAKIIHFEKKKMNLLTNKQQKS